MADFVRNLAIESWTLFAVGMLLIVGRTVSRRISLGGWSKLQAEDYLMVFAGATFTADIWSINETAKNGSNYMSDEVAASLTPDEVAKAVYGSKMTLALEIFTLTTVWTVKACLLLLYHRLTLGYDAQHRAVKLIAAYCAVSYVLVVALCLSYWCAPIQEYWRVPVKFPQCATYYNHMIFATAFNISSDLMLLCIPIPIVVRSRLPPKRKIVLCCVLGLGGLNIFTAILNRYYNFSNPNDLGYVHWYVAEVATAVFVGNVPLCWPLLRRIFRGVGSFSASSSDDGDMRDGDKKHRLPIFDGDSHGRDGRQGRHGRQKRRKGPLSMPTSLWQTTRAASVHETTAAHLGEAMDGKRADGGQSKQSSQQGIYAVEDDDEHARENTGSDSLELEERDWSGKKYETMVAEREVAALAARNADLEAGFGTARA